MEEDIYEDLSSVIRNIEKITYTAIKSSEGIIKTELGLYSISKYNENGSLILLGKTNNLLSDKGMIDSGSLYINLYSYEYNKDKMLISERCKSSKGELIHNLFYEYSPNGDIVRANKFNSNGNLISSTFYDEIGNIREINIYKSDNNIDYKVFSKYDSNNNLVERNTYDLDSNFKQKEIFRYNAKGDKIEYSYFDIDDIMYSKFITYKYEYDKKDNWIKRITKDEDNYRITTRRIVYFGEDSENKPRHWKSPFYYRIKEGKDVNLLNKY